MTRPYSMQTVEALGETIRQYDAALQPDQQPVGQHRAVPLRASYFLGGLTEAEGLVRGRRFLDVGCGLGSKLAVAYHLGWQVWGIDNWAPYVEQARRIVPQAHIAHADAFDFCNYAEFDLVYAYKPRTDNDEEQELEEWITAHMRSGAIAFFVGLDSVPNAEPVGGNLWRIK